MSQHIYQCLSEFKDLWLILISESSLCLEWNIYFSKKLFIYAIEVIIEISLQWHSVCVSFRRIRIRSASNLKIINHKIIECFSYGIFSSKHEKTCNCYFAINGDPYF